MLRAATACTFSRSNGNRIAKKWSLPLVLLRCSLPNAHRATTACNFFSGHLASWLRPRRFSEPTFPPSGATKDWKNTVFRDFLAFSFTCIFSLLTFSISCLLPSDFLHVQVSSWLCFFLAVLFICPYCRNFSC